MGMKADDPRPGPRVSLNRWRAIVDQKLSGNTLVKTCMPKPFQTILSNRVWARATTDGRNLD